MLSNQSKCPLHMNFITIIMITFLELYHYGREVFCKIHIVTGCIPSPILYVTYYNKHVIFISSKINFCEAIKYNIHQLLKKKHKSHYHTMAGKSSCLLFCQEDLMPSELNDLKFTLTFAYMPTLPDYVGVSWKQN